VADTINTARAAILDLICIANAGVDAGACAAEYETIARSYQVSASMDRATILKMFAERLREYDAGVHETASANLRGAIGQVFAAYRQQSVVAADGFPLQSLPEGFRCQTEAQADIDALNAAEGAIVMCQVAIAHTGTIVLNGSRRLTLLPDRLLCVVHEDQVVETVPEAIARLQPFAANALTFVSGPSATADIEMTRIRGVHGPRILDVVLVTN
jgi:L-lactate dehydrogenase complex protein LldG